MLVELRIRDYAVVEDLTLELSHGLNALTGETGAGKSIIVGALSLLLGERASSGVVRQGADRATVEAVFDVSDRPEIDQTVTRLSSMLPASSYDRNFNPPRPVPQRFDGAFGVSCAANAIVGRRMRLLTLW